MDEEYLATGFRDIDGAQNQGAYFECLTLLDSLPYYRKYKSQSYDLLELRPGQTVLEAGCGFGDDVFRMAERVMPGGKVVGVDASAAMISKAKSRDLTARLPVEFMVGDIKSPPFTDNSFARCRIDRVLQTSASRNAPSPSLSASLSRTACFWRASISHRFSCS